MFNHLIFPSNVLQPGEASLLRDAVQVAMSKLGGPAAVSADDQRVLAEDIILIAKAGYTRAPDGSQDLELLSDAAVTRFKSFSAASPHSECEPM